MKKTVYDIGYIGEGKYVAKKDGVMTDVYDAWHDMMKRGYDEKYKKRFPTYKDAYVCEEWHNFQVFAEWYYEKLYNCNGEKMHVDKDILVKGNKIYSPETCILVPQRINKLFLKRQNDRGQYPIGVCYHKQHNKLCVRCNIITIDGKSKSTWLGLFPLNEPFHAFYTYKTFKENYIKQVADEYKELIPIELYNAMYRYEVGIND